MNQQIALIAHDRMKQELLAFVQKNIDYFRQHSLVATGNTGAMLAEHTGLVIERVAHRPEGGDLISIA